MAWVYLIIAGLCEIGWPLGLKLAQTSPHWKIGGYALAVVSITLSGIFLLMAQRSIPMGTAYAVWTGIGAIGTFAVGVALFKDPVNLLRIMSVLLIFVGIVGLRLAARP